MPVYDTGDPKVKRVRVWWRGKPVERRVRHASGAPVTEGEARAYEARLRTQLEAGRPAETRAVPTFSAFCSGPTGAYYLYAHSAGRMKARTLSNRKYQLRTLCEFFGGYRINEIGAPEVLAYQSWRGAGGAGRRPARPTTVNSDVRLLRAVLNYARKLGVPAQPVAVGDIPVRGERRARAWTAEQAERLLEAAWREGGELYGMVLTMLNTGMRKGEVLALRWSMVDLDARVINLEGCEAWTPKDEEPREIPVSDALAAWFGVRDRSGSHVFAPSRRGGERFAYWPQRKFDRAIRAAKLSGGAHSCRHTYASHFLSRNPDLDLLRRILGHSTVRVTERVYGHMLPGRLDAARNAVNFGGAGTEVRARAKWGKEE